MNTNVVACAVSAHSGFPLGTPMNRQKAADCTAQPLVRRTLGMVVAVLVSSTESNRSGVWHKRLHNIRSIRAQTIFCNGSRAGLRCIGLSQSGRLPPQRQTNGAQRRGYNSAIRRDFQACEESCWNFLALARQVGVPDHGGKLDGAFSSTASAQVGKRSGRSPLHQAAAFHFIEGRGNYPRS